MQLQEFQINKKMQVLNIFGQGCTHIQSSKNPETVEYLENEAFFRKMFQTKI